MLTLRIIPCLDVRDGRVVKGVRFANLRDAGSPEMLAALYERDGADELVMLDVSATPEGRAASLDTVRRICAAINIPLTVGGGVRRIEDAARFLEAGADKVGVNTAAVENPAPGVGTRRAFWPAVHRHRHRCRRRGSGSLDRGHALGSD